MWINVLIVQIHHGKVSELQVKDDGRLLKPKIAEFRFNFGADFTASPQ
jgi:hypothetical protein